MMSPKLPSVFIIFCVLSLASVQAQNSIVVIPQVKNDWCHALTNNPDLQSVITTVDAGFRDDAWSTTSFIAAIRKTSTEGGCDSFNPQQILQNIIRASSSSVYVLANADVQQVQGQYQALLDLMVYQASTHQSIIHISKKSDLLPTSDIEGLVINAFKKCLPLLNKHLAHIKQNVVSKNLPTSSLNNTSTADINFNLPKTKLQNPDAIAVVIGNRFYKKTKNVQFAHNDAAAIKKYLTDVLGYKEGNIFVLQDALKSDFELFFGIKGNHKGKLHNTLKPGKSDIFIYYSGHGAPGLKDHQAYFVPVECDPHYVELGGYPLSVFYQNLAKLPAKSTTVVLDACFSGNTIFENISPIRVKSKGIKGIKNGVLLAATGQDQVASWYNAKQHGMFTYFLLKAIHNKNADTNNDNRLTFREVYRFIADKTNGLPYYARRIHGIEQSPIIGGNAQQTTWISFD